MKQAFFFLTLLICWPGFSYCQDILYLRDGSTLEGETIGTSADAVSFKPTNNPEKTIGKDDLLMMILSYGDYFLFHESLTNGHHRVAFDNDYYEKIIKVNGEMIPAESCQALSKEVKYTHLLSSDGGTLGKNEVAIVLFREGNHRLYATPVKAANALARYNSLQITLSSKTISQPQQDPPDDPDPVPGTVESNPVTNNDPPPVEPDEPVEPQEKEITIDEPVRTPATLPVDEAEFKRKATQRTKELTTYIARISDKRTPPLEANKSIDLAVELFVSDTCRIEVSSKNRPDVTRYKVRPYLQHVKLLKYDKVEITWAEVNYVGDIRKGPDNNYYGYVTFMQVFRGFQDGEVVYEDRTEKRVEVMFKGYTKLEQGSGQDLWDVLLSNIKVTQTI